ncbi:Ankyrin repeat-containing protein ITN1, partial [Bienertia sinuspersici]
EGEDICRLFLKKVPELTTRKGNGLTIFHAWALKGKLWPFECLLNSSDIIPDARKIFSELTSTTNEYSATALHFLSKFKGTTGEDAVKIGKLLIDTYKQDVLSLNISTRELQLPWLISNVHGETPLDLAIWYENENFAFMILSEDENALHTCQNDALFMAIENRFDKVPQKILEIVDKKGWTHLLINDQKQSALHLAPICNNKEFYEQLLKGHPELLKDDKDGNSILHYWVRIGQVWPFEYLFKSVEFDQKGRSRFAEFISYIDFNDKNNPIHIAATCTHEATHQIIKLLVEAFQEKNPNWMNYHKSMLPWWNKNLHDEGPLHLALRCQRDQKIASYLLSLNQDGSMHDLLDYYAPKEHEILFLAIKNNFVDIVKMILTSLNKASWTKYLKDVSNGQNVLHLASNCTDKELGRWLVEEAPEFITEPDINAITPLEVASNVGAAWIIEAMLQKDPSSTFNKVPFAWVGACENGHVSVVRIFIEYCPEKFSDHCILHEDSPLHHIKLRNLMAYEEFLKIPCMKDLINVPDFNGATPLHKAIRKQNILLAEALLNMDNIKYNVKDDKGITARGLLAQLCNDKQQPQWDLMCKSIGFDPNITTSYFQHKTNLLEVRNTLSVVAALLATITFTAGFTVPGGFDQNTGEAMLADKAAFLVFLISDTLAMCLSMLVLMFLIWSMVFEPNQSLALIDRSVGLIRAALYFTLLAFVTGVYIVILPSHHGLPSCKESRDPMPLMEEGISLVSHHEENSNQEAPLLAKETITWEMEELEYLNYL